MSINLRRTLWAQPLTYAEELSHSEAVRAAALFFWWGGSSFFNVDVLVSIELAGEYGNQKPVLIENWFPVVQFLGIVGLLACRSCCCCTTICMYVFMFITQKDKSAAVKLHHATSALCKLMLS